MTNRRPNSRLFLSRLITVWAGLALVPLNTQATEATSPPRPNILLILADDLGFSDLGSYGSEISTPGRPCRPRLALHPVLQCSALLPHAGCPPHRIVPTPGWCRSHAAELEPHCYSVFCWSQQSLCHHCRLAAIRQLSNLSLGQVTCRRIWPRTDQELSARPRFRPLLRHVRRINSGKTGRVAALPASSYQPSKGYRKKSEPVKE